MDNFGEIIDEILTQMGKTRDEIEDTILESIKRRINTLESKINLSDAWEWRKARYYFSTRAPLEDGTVGVTKNSKDVTGSGTAFTNIIKYGSLLINGHFFKVDPHTAVTTTSFSLTAKLSFIFSRLNLKSFSFPILVLRSNIRLCSILTF